MCCQMRYRTHTRFVTVYGSAELIRNYVSNMLLGNPHKVLAVSENSRPLVLGGVIFNELDIEHNVRQVPSHNPVV